MSTHLNDRFPAGTGDEELVAVDARSSSLVCHETRRARAIGCLNGRVIAPQRTTPAAVAAILLNVRANATWVRLW